MLSKVKVNGQAARLSTILLVKYNAIKERMKNKWFIHKKKLDQKEQ